MAWECWEDQARVCSVVQVQEWLGVLEPVWLWVRALGRLQAADLAAFLQFHPGVGPPPVLVVRYC